MSTQITPPQRRWVVPVVLLIVCALLLAATIALATTTFRLWGDRTGADAEPAASPSPTPTDFAEPQTVQGIEVTSNSELTFGNWAMDPIDRERRHSRLYATITSVDAAQAAEVGFDATAYTADGRIIDRAPAHMYLLPEQTSMFNAIFSEDLTDVASIVVEQTSIELAAPAFTGEIITDSLAPEDSEFTNLVGEFTSTLSEAPWYPEFVLAGFVDDELFGLCSTTDEIPAGASFTADCYVEPVGKDDVPEELLEFPADAVFKAFINFESPR